MHSTPRRNEERAAISVRRRSDSVVAVRCNIITRAFAVRATNLLQIRPLSVWPIEWSTLDFPRCMVRWRVVLSPYTAVIFSASERTVDDRDVTVYDDVFVVVVIRLANVQGLWSVVTGQASTLEPKIQPQRINILKCTGTRYKSFTVVVVTRTVNLTLYIPDPRRTFPLTICEGVPAKL